jgi:ABC-type branched-subunit amino acid transport system ATPase component
MLQIVAITHYYLGIPALSDITVDINPGVTGLIGPNGSGKSTLLNIISGSLKPSSGAIWCNGVDLASLSPHAASSRGVSRMFQHSRLSRELNLFDNISLGTYRSHGALRMRWSRNTAAMVSEAAAVCGIEERRLTSYPDDASFFEQRMTELARCIAAKSTKVLLLDEPAAGFTELERRRVGRIISKLKATMMVVLVEHDLDLVREVSGQVVVLAGGRLLSAGKPASVLSEPRVVEAYLGRNHVAC